jgi:asparagine synthase (glutamine-hydrolysing)
LADGYLTKVDIAAMTSAVEVRPPFLDHRLVELAMTIPSKQKIRRHDLKHLWKGMMHGKIPDQIIGRPKVGFALPLGDMLTNQLKPMIEDILLQPKSLPENYFSHNAVKQLWQDHQNKKADYTNHLWSLLMLSLWLKEYSV